jgi:hypothetical protein
MANLTKNYNREAMKPSQIEAINLVFKMNIIVAMHDGNDCELSGNEDGQGGFEFMLKVAGKSHQRASIGPLGKILYNENFICGTWA